MLIVKTSTVTWRCLLHGRQKTLARVIHVKKPQIHCFSTLRNTILLEIDGFMRSTIKMINFGMHHSPNGKGAEILDFEKTMDITVHYLAQHNTALSVICFSPFLESIYCYFFQKDKT